MFKSMTAFTLAAIIGTACLTTVPASAKDWIESVKLSTDGIDIPPYEVVTDGKAYKSIKTKTHTYSFGLYARATNGERIVAAALGSLSGVNYFEAADSKEWRVKLANREVGSGTLRTWKRSYSAKVPTSRVNWKGRNPVKYCNDVLKAKRAQGMRASEVFSKSWSGTVNAYFQLQAVAARKNKAKNNKWSIKNTTSQRSSLTYPVRVVCLAK